MIHTLPISDFAREFEFGDIRPFYEAEAPAIVNRLISDPLFMKLVQYLWPDMSIEEVNDKAKSIHTPLDFQLAFMHEAIRNIVGSSSSGLSSSGFELLDPQKSYLFISNHRDILLDAAILQILLVEHGFSTTEISFGSNLMEEGFINDFGKLNRMFKVQREGTSKELYEISRKLSAYIRHTILDKKTSIWLAQRNGRTKDGSDSTQNGLLKMLNISGKKGFLENFEQLSLVPVTISYEYEPCDYLKTQEIYLSNLHTRYTKAPGEDLNSILTGIRQFKGRIHLNINKPLDHKEMVVLDKYESENDKIKILAGMIDQRICENYRTHPIHYVAADLLEKSYKRSGHYTPGEKQNFMDYMTKSIQKITGEPEALEQLFLKIYAAPVFNKNE